ncbi:hypothetical protein ACFL6X_09070 [Candidatus Latescibacterota bacterium]
MIPLLLTAAAGLLGLAALGRRYLQQRRRVRLRLVKGKSALLAQDLEQAVSSLEELQEEGLAAVTEEASRALDELHASLLDRQAHLQNYEDLARLQQHKIAILVRATGDAAAEETGGGAADETQTRPPEEALETAIEHRDRVEDELLKKIEELRPDPPQSAPGAKQEGRPGKPKRPQ